MYTIWLADADWVSDGQGGYEMRPHQMVLASAYGDAIKVDEWDKEGDMPLAAGCCARVIGTTPEALWKRKYPSRGVQIDAAKLTNEC